jgi:hypothetical protein
MINFLVSRVLSIKKNFELRRIRITGIIFLKMRVAFAQNVPELSLETGHISYMFLYIRGSSKQIPEKYRSFSRIYHTLTYQGRL